MKTELKICFLQDVQKTGTEILNQTPEPEKINEIFSNTLNTSLNENIMETQNEPSLKTNDVHLTLDPNVQIILDNNEVLLTLNDKTYGVLLINNKITMVDNEVHCLYFNNKNEELQSNDFNLTDTVLQFNEPMSNDLNYDDSMKYNTVSLEGLDWNNCSLNDNVKDNFIFFKSLNTNKTDG